MIKTKFLIAASLSVILAGCSAMGTNTSLYSVHQPVVERTNYSIDLNTDGGNGISMTEKTRLGEWFDALNVGYGDRVTLDYGNGYVDAAVRLDVSIITNKHGVAIEETPPVTAGNVNSGVVRVIVTRSKASVPSCPDHTSTTDANLNSSTSNNYGCAMNTNLAAMVADPEDLVRGRQTSPMNASGSNASIKANRDKRQGATK